MEQLGYDAGLREILVELFCDIYDFCNGFEDYWHKHLVRDGAKIMPKPAMSLSEVMTIVVFFHLSGTFKWYYNNLICEFTKDFPPKG